MSFLSLAPCTALPNRQPFPWAGTAGSYGSWSVVQVCTEAASRLGFLAGYDVPSSCGKPSRLFRFRLRLDGGLLRRTPLLLLLCTYLGTESLLYTVRVHFVSSPVVCMMEYGNSKGLRA